MRFRHFVVGAVGLVLLSGSPGNASEARLRIEVSPRVSAAPAVVTVRAIVPPSQDNRALQIVVDSGNYYRSSMVALDGANAATVTETRLKNLPGGDYEVIVVLVDVNGKRTQDRRSVVVTSSSSEY